MRLSWRFVFVVLLAGCSALGSASPSGVRTHQSDPRAKSPGLATLVSQPLPARNLYQLANQLTLHPPRPISHVVRTTSPDYSVGHKDNFYVLSEDQNRYFVMPATIRVKTAHLYIYVQDGTYANIAAAQQAAQTFEQHIYPTDRSFYGSEWRPGIDGDQHITCLIGNLKSSGAGGYFSAEDEYPKLVNPWSNQREMIYINAANTLPGGDGFLQTLAHEFQHMIHFHMHFHDNAWLNEGMSMVAELLNDYSPVNEPSSFASQPTTQLNSWSLDASTFAHYGAAYLYLTYLYDRFGHGMIHDMLADSRYTDFELVNDVLHRRHISETADQIFGQWVVANYLNNRSLAHGLYSYRQLSYKVQVPQSDSKALPFSFKSSIPPYAAKYIVMSSLQNHNAFTLHFSAPTTVPAVGFTNDAGPFWWSDRGDLSDTRMQRAVDLTHVHQATLHFQTWYDIEKNYDYGYVEASRDGGKTWKTLKGTDTTNTNPYGANYGNGYTGSSGGWHNETVNLSAYAGKHILLRFQYITDDEYNGQGMVVKNIAIPQIGYRDHFTGWKRQGFVPVTKNAMPATWHVELLATTTKGTTVTQLPLSKTQHGSMLVNPARQGLKKLVAVVYTTAPKTTVKSTFQLSAK